MSVISRRELKVGMISADNVQDQRGRLLIAAGMELTDRHIKALKLWGISSISTADKPAMDDVAGTQLLSPEVLKQARRRALGAFQHNAALLDHPSVNQLFLQLVQRLARNLNSEGMPREEPSGVQISASDQNASGPDATEREPNKYSLVTLVEETRTLASLPEIHNELMEVVNHPRSSVEDVSKVISTDTGLTARLLQIVNSAFYGFSNEIDTVSWAASLVGTNELCELALSTSVSEVFERLSSDLIDMKMFWHHSIWCGVIARLLAKKSNESNPERFFVMGLLHDIGRLVIFTQIPQAGSQILDVVDRTRQPFDSAEVAILGFNHASVGAALLANWKLPLSQQEAIHFHHHPTKSDAYAKEAVIIHVADCMTNAVFGGYSKNILIPPFDIHAWDKLGIEPGLLLSIIEAAEIQVNGLANILGVE